MSSLLNLTPHVASDYLFIQITNVYNIIKLNNNVDKTNSNILKKS